MKQSFKMIKTFIGVEKSIKMALVEIELLLPLRIRKLKFSKIWLMSLDLSNML